jgi:hypothetical protein
VVGKNKILKIIVYVIPAGIHLHWKKLYCYLPFWLDSSSTRYYKINSLLYVRLINWYMFGTIQSCRRNLTRFVNILFISSSDNKSVSHWIMFDYFFHVWKVNIFFFLIMFLIYSCSHVYSSMENRSIIITYWSIFVYTPFFQMASYDVT